MQDPKQDPNPKLYKKVGSRSEEKSFLSTALQILGSIIIVYLYSKKGHHAVWYFSSNVLSRIRMRSSRYKKMLIIIIVQILEVVAYYL